MMNPAEFANIARAEHGFWWYRGMRRILDALLDPVLAGRRIETVLEAGCGTGYQSRLFEQRRHWRMVLLDLGWEGLRFASGMGLRRLVQADICALPFAAESFDAVFSLDVVVHLPRGREYEAAAELVRVLRPGGLLVLRVSALDILRSRHSRFAGERQRFTRGRLAALAARHGLRALRLTYANSLLLPIALFKFRVWEPLLNRPPASGVTPVPAWLNRLLEIPLSIEARWLASGGNFPAGQSLILIGEKELAEFPSGPGLPSMHTAVEPEAIPVWAAVASFICRRERWLVAGILLVLAGALAWQAWRVGVTADEPGHMVSAILYWRGEDQLQPRDMPPLIKIVGGWVPGLFPDLLLPRDNPSWSSHSEWMVGLEMVDKMDVRRVRRVFFFSRLPFLVFPLLTAFLVWWWARQLFSPAAALWITAAYTLEPTALGHGALFKNDVAATFGHLLFWYLAWRFWRRPSLARCAWLGAGLLVAVLAKLSMLVLPPVAAAIVLSRYATWKPRRWGALAGGPILLLAIPYLGALAACQFEARRLSPPEINGLRQNPRLPPGFARAAAVFGLLPLPAPMWDGLLNLMWNGAQDSGVYLLGRRYPHGHPLYFPIALGVKIPFSLQLALLLGLALLAVSLLRRHPPPMPAAFFLLPPALYIGLASASALQYGVRLVLPALPFGLLICGLAIQWLLDHRRAVVVACLLAWLAIRTAAVYPHTIAYFNVWTGGPDYGLRYLADSNLDWGQSLPDLADLVRRRRIRFLRLSYFGQDNPYRYFKNDQVELVPPPWDDGLARGTVLKPEAGVWAVSANLLPGHLFKPEYRDYYREFRLLAPVAKAGYSIYLYEVKP